VASLNAQRRLGISTEALGNSASKLASGERINKAADDAAGLAISENLRADVRSLNQAKRNTLDAVSLVQTAEGGLNETSSMLIRLRELAIKSASDTVGPRERGYLDQEFQALKSEIDRIAQTTEFNGTRLLIGTRAVGEDMVKNAPEFPLEIQVGKDYYKTSDALDAAGPVNVIRINLNELNAFASGENSLQLDQSLAGEQVDGIAVKTQAQMAIGRMDEALSQVSSYRAYLGAIQNRLEHASANTAVETENLDTARSRIRDTDFAAETAEYTKSKILQSAGTSVLAQANQQPQIALSLLQNL
jgi:flagellin